MKYILIFSFVAFVLFFSSCSKETVLPIQVSKSGAVIQERSTTIEIPVSKVTYLVDSGEMTVDFDASFDFTEVVVEPTQFLEFEDASQNISTLTFQTISYTGSNGELQIIFDLGTNNLSGLTLTETQDIIIEDEIIE